VKISFFTLLEVAAMSPISTGPTYGPAVVARALPDRPTTRNVPELDGVRGVAILLVLLCHSAMIQAMPVPDSLAFLHLPGFLFLGWSGVDLFFVLSGFLISGILLDTKESKNYFSSFYARRALRILPLYLVSVFAYFHIALPLAHRFGQWPNLTNSLEIWFWLHLSNWQIALGKNGNWVGHFWSLAIEEQFYLFWPIVVFIAGRKWLPHVCIGLIGLSFGLRCLYAHNAYGEFFLYGLTPFRVEPLAFGSLAAVLIRNLKIRPFLSSRRFLFGIAFCGVLMLGVTLLQGRSFEFKAAPMATYGYSSFALLYVALVLYADLHSGSSAWLSPYLRTNLLRAFGKYSYGIYVFHLPLFKAYGHVVSRVSAVLPGSLRLAFWLTAVIAGIGLAYAIAIVSWNVVEKRFWNLKYRFAVRY
jgi:peptidoglycan/LPS O-acetylase OafA/YrhL